jgi:hypothetical protein
LPKSSVLRIRTSDRDKLSRYSKKHDLTIPEALGIAIKKLEVNPLESKTEDTMICCECEVEIPDICKFCPNCGAEFELDASDRPITMSEDELKDEDEDEEEDEEEEEG